MRVTVPGARKELSLEVSSVHRQGAHAHVLEELNTRSNQSSVGHGEREREEREREGGGGGRVEISRWPWQTVGAVDVSYSTRRRRYT